MAYTSITSRLLNPADFGYYASAQALAILVGYLSLISLGSAVMRHPPERAGNLARVSLLLALFTGVLAGLLVAYCAPWWAAFWGISAGTGVVRVIAIPVALAPVSAVLLALMRRRFEFRTTAIAEFFGGLVGMLVGVAYVLPTTSVVGLVYGQSAASLTICLLCLPSLRRKEDHSGDAQGLQFPPASTDIRELLSFSAQVGLQNFVYFIIFGLPAFATSRFLGASALGMYSRANLLVAIPLTQMSQALTRVLYPMWSRVNLQARQRGVTDSLVVASLVSALAFGALGGLAEPVVRLLFGGKFMAAVPAVQWFSLFGVVNLLVVIAGSVQESAGWMRDIWRIQVAKLALLIMALSSMLFVPRIDVAIAALCLSQVFGHGLQVRQLAKKDYLETRRLLHAYSWHLALGLAAFLGTATLTTLTDGVFTQVATSAVWLWLLMLFMVRYAWYIPGIVVLRSRGFLTMLSGPVLDRLARIIRSGSA